MASYDLCMESSELRDLLLCALSRPGYGDTAEEVLRACRLVVQAEQTFNKKQIFDIRQDLEMSDQIWKRLFGIGQNETLWLLRQELPPNYSSLYRLNLIEPHNVIIGARDGSINPQTTTRDVEQIARKERINSRYKLSNRQVFFFTGKELGDDEFSNLLEEVNKVAREYECCFDSENLENVRKKDARYQYDRRMEDIRWLIRQDIENFKIVESLYDEIEDEQERDALSNQLIDLPFKEFVESLMSVAHSRESMMREFGFLYCLKIAHDYWRTESRSQRYNYKRRLLEVREKYPDLSEDVDYVFDKHINVEL